MFSDLIMFYNADCSIQIGESWSIAPVFALKPPGDKTAFQFCYLIDIFTLQRRATYPCMRTAAPFMSAFVIYLIGIATSVVAFKRARSHFLNARYLGAGLFVLDALGRTVHRFTGPGSGGAPGSEAGPQQIRWNMNDQVSAGLYFVVLKTETGYMSRKMIVSR